MQGKQDKQEDPAPKIGAELTADEQAPVEGKIPAEVIKAVAFPISHRRLGEDVAAVVLRGPRRVVVVVVAASAHGGVPRLSGRLGACSTGATKGLDGALHLRRSAGFQLHAAGALGGADGRVRPTTACP
jgi:hypothetical protein